NWYRINGSLTDKRLRGVWGVRYPSYRVWIVGDNGTILSYDGAIWSSQAGSSSIFRSVWGSGPADAWVVGNVGEQRHFLGGLWQPAGSNVMDDYFGVWGSAPGNVWAAGTNGTLGIMKLFNGTMWIDKTIPMVGPLRSITGSDASNM